MKKGILVMAIFTLLIGVKVKASQQVTKWAVMYTNEGRTTQGTSATLTSNLDMNYTITKFYWTNNNTNVYEYQGGYVIIPFTIQTPILVTGTNNEVEVLDEECDRWGKVTSGGVEYWDCKRYSTSSYSYTTQDREFIVPTTAVKAKLYTKHNNTSYNVACFVENGSFKCPINYGVDYMDYIQIESNVNYGSSNLTKQYKIEITNFIIVEYDTTNQIIENQNSNTQQIINSNTTYEDKSEQYTNETQEMEEYKDKEKQLFESMNFTALDNLDITINPESSNFIWEIVERIRGISNKIVLLMTSVLGLGIIKMILNR